MPQTRSGMIATCFKLLRRFSLPLTLACSTATRAVSLFQSPPEIPLSSYPGREVPQRLWVGAISSEDSAQLLLIDAILPVGLYMQFQSPPEIRSPADIMDGETTEQINIIFQSPLEIRWPSDSPSSLRCRPRKTGFNLRQRFGLPHTM